MLVKFTNVSKILLMLVNDAFSFFDTLLMHFWCTFDAFSFFYAFLMHFWCTFDALFDALLMHFPFFHILLILHKSNKILRKIF